MEKKIVIRNIIFALLLQIITMLSGFIIPKIILSEFGSDVNGMIASSNQFLNYIQLLEGGLSGVIMAALYKPLNDNDYEKVSSIVSATQKFFRKIGLIYAIYAIGVALIYPIFVHINGFNYSYTVTLILVLAMNLFVQYFFSITYKILLNADRKVFFVSLTQMIIIILNTVSVVFCARVFKDILVIKLFSALIFFVQPIFFGTYVNKHFRLNTRAIPDEEALKQRWNGFGVNLAYFIHTNTDMVILTLLSTLANVSVYSVYLMIVNALKNLVMSISQAIVPSFGKTVATGEQEKMHDVFDKFEFIIYFISTVLFTSGMVLVTPFIDVYTMNIHDAEYHQKAFGIILTLAEMVYCIRDPYVSVSYSAGHFKQIAKFAYIEAGMNIIISIVLVYKFGLIGISIGTLISMMYRMMAHICYIKKNIMFRTYRKAIKAFFVFGSISCLCYLGITSFIDLSFTNYSSFFVYGIITGIIISLITTVLSLPFYRNTIKKVLCK